MPALFANGTGTGAGLFKKLFSQFENGFIYRFIDFNLIDDQFPERQ